MFDLKRVFAHESSDEKVAFDVQSICDGHHHVTYRGVKAIRCPFGNMLSICFYHYFIQNKLILVRTWSCYFILLTVNV